MKSKMSFFDPTLLKKNVARFAPAWAILTLALFLALPLPLLRRLGERFFIDAERTSNVLRILEEDLFPVGVVFACFAGLLFAALVFKYLHSARAAYMMHAFPMTRSCQFLTNAVSGLLFWLVPCLFIGLCTQGILAANGVGGVSGTLWALLGKWLLAFLLFYGLAVFAMHLSGRTVIAVLSYGAFNIIFLYLPILILMLVGCYFKGFDYTFSDKLLRLAPLGAMLTDAGNWALYAVYGAVGVGLLVLARVLYRFRQIERAGDAMVFGWARVAFRLLFTLCCTLGLGWLLAEIFEATLNGSRVFLPYALIGCVLGWFGASMMLERTVKVFRNKKVWLGFAAFAGILVLSVACLKYDLLGFQRRIPEAGKVESVEIWTRDDGDGYGSFPADRVELTETADVETVLAIHEKVLEHAGANRSYMDVFDGSSYNTVHICYHLSGGGTLRRAYELNLNDGYSKLAAIYSRPDVAETWYAEVLPETFDRVLLEGKFEEAVDEYGMVNVGYEDLECRDPAALREAVLADAAAGRLPIVNFLTLNAELYENAFCEGRGYLYSSDLQLWFEFNRSARGSFYAFAIPITESATETIKLFER